jgi:hypothetical protein
LDSFEIRIDFIGSVHGKVEPIDLLQRDERYPAALGVSTRRFRGRNANNLEASLHTLSEQFDEMLGSRACPESQLHAVPHLLDRTRRSLSFQIVHRHHRPRRSAPMEREAYSAVSTAVDTALRAKNGQNGQT